ncbi:Abi family protein [Pseudomonas sp. A3.4]|nr:Abi family protein [Atopomonas sediminilitoris]
MFQLEQDPASNAIRSVRTDQFEADTQFGDAVELYLFDKKLRLLVMDALERIQKSKKGDTH